ncbi:MAG: glycosyltransferase [Flavobacteriales bacterium]|jgi:GT2 family glycosyltransferase|tara:strand:- start:537 stop:2489 length:1953 start_codon:yes stop_codon:yes gene_type:complete
MKISIIIVNYNVKYFLEQCLQSVHKAIEHMDAEVFVVDNNSVDRSVEMVAEKFPWVNLIANKENTGFSVANNQAMRIAKGAYFLLLNPDTIVEQDTFEKSVAFMDANPIAGGLGVKMVDGKGKFLPESKRSLPTPAVAFYKIFGLSKIFPKSKRFGAYHLGHLPENETNEADILAGAYMLMRKEALDKVGLLDETFFMYGEDIDLSYRLILGGYKNYYFPETRIIHYKGESTKKGSLNYVFMFYKAMIIFAQKHFSTKNAWLFSSLINTAIYLRALASISARFVKTIALPIFDVSLIYVGMIYLKNYWEANHRYIEGGAYPDIYWQVVIPAYILIWLAIDKLSGVYDKPFKLSKLVRGTIYGLITLLAIYSLLPEELRFSRALILMGGIWSGIALTLSRSLFKLFKLKSFQWGEIIQKRFLIIGSEEECIRVFNLLKQTDIQTGFIGFIHIENKIEKHDLYLGQINQLEEAVGVYEIDELIFCSKDLSAQEIIAHMSVIDKHDLDFKIAPEESLYVIGSNSINTQGEHYAFELSSINKQENIRNKRFFDITSSLVLLAFSPILILLNKNFLNVLKNILLVLMGVKSWVSYHEIGKKDALPKIKEGVLNPVSHLKSKLTERTIFKLNMLYAKEYQVKNDFDILLKNLNRIS